MFWVPGTGGRWSNPSCYPDRIETFNSRLGDGPWREEALPPNDFETENVMADASLYEAVGLGLGKSEMYGVMLAGAYTRSTFRLNVSTFCGIR
jgi:hypothetical protein